ncbi:hypothetical protein [Nocardioides jensenii]|uniref:hypothetical protein n=1 Tax=Nocardioides jensenii TaxID=1843 RepID=UPI00082C840C|nr:hypothetical protein [Nocardioides jensenii]
MVILGFVLILISAVAILGAIFLLDGTGVEYFGADVPPVTLFVVGALCVVFIGMGAKLMTSGTKRSLRARKEQRLEERRQKDEQERSGDHETS